MLAMPETNVEKTSGPMIILILRRKISVIIEKWSAMILARSDPAMALHMQPTTTPRSMLSMIQRVSLLLICTVVTKYLTLEAMSRTRGEQIAAAAVSARELTPIRRFMSNAVPTGK
jgi:hypothetical protein